MGVSSITVPEGGLYHASVRVGDRWKETSQYDLFDKIINIKFRRKSGREFCIRSDYEVALDRAGRPYFVRCKQKPSIHVKYTQVSNTKSIKVEIRIANFFILNENADNSIFRYNGDPIISAEIHMGYRNQFINWTLPPYNADTEDTANITHAQNRLNVFYRMLDHTLVGEQDPADTSLRQSVMVLGVYPEGIPPETTIFIQGIVGTMDFGFAWTHDDPRSMPMRTYFTQDANFPRLPIERNGTPYTNLEKILYTYITKRFIRTGDFTYSLYDSDQDPSYTGEDRIRTIKVLDYVDGKIVSTPEQLNKPIDERWSDALSMENGLLSVADAEALGVKCTISPGLLRLSQTSTVPRTGPDGQAIETPVEVVPDIPFQELVGAQLEAIKAEFPDIRWYIQPDSSYYFYDANETASDITTNAENFQRVYLSKRPITLPAVYDISIGGLRQIRCPFIGFVTFMQRVRFIAKYNIGSTVGFFYPHNKDEWFQVISIEVSFDTTGDENMMTMKCIDADPPEEDTVELPITTPATPTTGKQLEWVSVTCGEVFTWPSGAKTSVPMTWSGLAIKFVLNNPGIDGADGITLSGMTTTDAITKLLENSDNSSNNDSWISDRPAMPASVLSQMGFGPHELGQIMKGDTFYIPMEKRP